MEKLQEVMEIFCNIGSGNELVVWSTNEDVFRVEQREWKGNWEGKVAPTVVVKLDNNTNVFWINSS